MPESPFFSSVHRIAPRNIKPTLVAPIDSARAAMLVSLRGSCVSYRAQRFAVHPLQHQPCRADDHEGDEEQQHA